MNTQKKTVRLVANENFYGPPPKAIEAINRYSSIVNEYPDFVPNSLKQKLADKYSVSAANITVGAGTYELIDIIIKALVAKEWWNTNLRQDIHGVRLSGRIEQQEMRYRRNDK